MRILFIGESWRGSCARSLKEALSRSANVILDEINEDAFFPKHRALWLRALNRILNHAYRQELYRQILHRANVFRPDIIMTYKGYSIQSECIHQLQALGYAVVNVYPDLSPHAHGIAHKKAVGEYDLVISTKPFHPTLWKNIYGYDNPCVFVPQGYDPNLHLVTKPQSNPRFDVTLVATWRPEYGNLLKNLSKLLKGYDISVGIGGNGWMAHRDDYPKEWIFMGGLEGHAYVDWLRQGRICLAPVTREVNISGAHQPGDEDSTRTYELAAAHCFFIHRRTELIQKLYDENTEVPMFDTPEELAEKIIHFLPRSEERRNMAEAAHRRAVPAYSLDKRADEILAVIQDMKIKR